MKTTIACGCLFYFVVSALIFIGVAYGINDMLHGQRNEIRDIITFVVAFLWIFPVPRGMVR